MDLPKRMILGLAAPVLALAFSGLVATIVLLISGDDVGAFWSRFIDAERVETPDRALNFMTNVWLKYQSISCRLWGKSAFYQVSAGYGFRDQLQDSQIFLIGEPDYARKQLLLHAAHQFIEGDVYHWWFAIRGGGPRTNWIVRG